MSAESVHAHLERASVPFVSTLIFFLLLGHSIISKGLPRARFNLTVLYFRGRMLL